MKRTLFILSFLCSLLSIGQDETWEEFTANARAISDSICAVDLKLEFDENLGLFGYVDSTGFSVIEHQYHCATEFIECIALTSKKKKCSTDLDSKKVKWFYINKKNEVVIPPRAQNRTKWDKKIKTTPNRVAGSSPK